MALKDTGFDNMADSASKFLNSRGTRPIYLARKVPNVPRVLRRAAKLSVRLASTAFPLSAIAYEG